MTNITATTGIAGPCHVYDAGTPANLRIPQGHRTPIESVPSDCASRKRRKASPSIPGHWRIEIRLVVSDAFPSRGNADDVQS
jgi:hypothetical protein